MCPHLTPLFSLSHDGKECIFVCGDHASFLWVPVPSTGSGTEQMLGQYLLNDWMLKGTEMNKQGLDKKR